MEYISNDNVPYFKECASVTDGEGFVLVELHVVPQKNSTKIEVVIASKDPARDIGVADCSKVHRALRPRIAALLGKSEDDLYMEVCSPGLERSIKNAAEFSCFTGREVRLWVRDVGDWVSGTILSSDAAQVTLDIKGKGSESFPYSDIAKAKFIHF